MAAISIFVVIAAYVGSIGNPFLASLGLVDPAVYGFAAIPNYIELAAIARPGVLSLAFLMMSGMVVFFVIVAAVPMILVSRNLFAWGFDQLVP